MNATESNARHRAELESSETIRQTLETQDEDMVRSAWRHAERGREMTAPSLYEAE